MESCILTPQPLKSKFVFRFDISEESRCTVWMYCQERDALLFKKPLGEKVKTAQKAIQNHPAARALLAVILLIILT